MKNEENKENNDYEFEYEYGTLKFSEITDENREGTIKILSDFVNRLKHDPNMMVHVGAFYKDAPLSELNISVSSRECVIKELSDFVNRLSRELGRDLTISVLAKCERPRSILPEVHFDAELQVFPLQNDDRNDKKYYISQSAQNCSLSLSDTMKQCRKQDIAHQKCDYS
jgi:hypothetical protein